MSFSSKIVEYRIKHNLTQEMFAKKISVSKTDVNNWELNDVKPSSETLISLSKILGIPIDELIFNDTDIVLKDTSAFYDFSNNHIKYNNKITIVDHNKKLKKGIDEIFLIKTMDIQAKSPKFKIVGYNPRKYLNELSFDLAYYKDLDEALKEFNCLKTITNTYTMQYGVKVKVTSFGIRIEKPKNIKE